MVGFFCLVRHSGTACGEFWYGLLDFLQLTISYMRLIMRIVLDNDVSVADKIEWRSVRLWIAHQLLFYVMRDNYHFSKHS